MILQLSTVFGWAILGLATANPQGIFSWGDKDSSANGKVEFGFNPFERFIENVNNKLDGDVEESSEKQDLHMDCDDDKEDATTENHGVVGSPIITYFRNKNLENSKDDQKTKNFPEKLLGIAIKFKRFPNRPKADDVDEMPMFPRRPFSIPTPLLEDPELSKPTHNNPLENLFSRLRLVGDNVPENSSKNLDTDNESAPNKEDTQEDSNKEETKEDTKEDTKEMTMNTVFNIRTLNVNSDSSKGKSFVNAMLNNNEITNGNPRSIQATFNIDTLNVGVNENTPNEDDSTLKNVDSSCHGDSCNGDNVTDNELGENDGDKLLPPKPDESDDVETEPLQILKNMLLKQQNIKQESELDHFNVDYKKNDGFLVIRRKKYERRPMLMQKDLDVDEPKVMTMLV